MKTIALKIISLTFLLILGLLSPANGQMAAVGPTNSVTGLPMWYQDTTGPTAQVLELCLDGDGGTTGPCIFDPVDPTNPFSVQTGFGAEAFYWYASSDLRATGGPARALLVLGLEAAYINGPPLQGDQTVFTRVRVRAGNLPADGVYTIIHPFGSVEINVALDVAQRVGREINYTLDIGFGIPGDFTGALQGSVGPFLRWTDPDFPYVDPVTGNSYLGNHLVDHEVTGSPFNTNVFQMIAPPGVILDPATGSNIMTTTLFNLTGKIATRYGVDVKRAVYNRDALGAGFIDVFATSQPAQQIQIGGIGAVPTAMVEQPGIGRYFARIPFVSPVPASITATNITDIPPIVFNHNPTDAVTISQSTYDTATQKVTVISNSSDLMVPPTFTAVQYPNAFVNGTMTVSPVTVPPAQITVNSGAGGSDTEPITVVGPQVP